MVLAKYQQEWDPDQHIEQNFNELKNKKETLPSADCPVPALVGQECLDKIV